MERSEAAVNPEMPCFNPWKGFGGFGTVPLFRKPKLMLSWASFNPWKGFGGFGTRAAGTCPLSQPEFQSLEGIWGFWNSRSSNDKSIRFSVSIPGRDLGVLEPIASLPMLHIEPVSIPGRDLGVLELMKRCTCKPSEVGKVSIPGRDLGVLELPDSFRRYTISYVSIPGRDLGVLEQIKLITT